MNTERELNSKKFYKFKTTNLLFTKPKIIEISGSGVQWIEGKGYTEMSTYKSVYVSRKDLLHNYKRIMSSSGLTIDNVFSKEFVQPTSLFFSNLKDLFLETFKNFFILVFRIITLPFVPIFTYILYISNKKLVNFIYKESTLLLNCK